MGSKHYLLAEAIVRDGGKYQPIRFLPPPPEQRRYNVVEEGAFEI